VRCSADSVHTCHICTYALNKNHNTLGVIRSKTLGKEICLGRVGRRAGVIERSCLVLLLLLLVQYFDRICKAKLIKSLRVIKISSSG
jgi:hypothetical protein